MFFVYCLIVFTAVILLCQTHLLYCQDTVVNWLLQRNNFVTLHVRIILIGTINSTPPPKREVYIKPKRDGAVLLILKCFNNSSW